MIVWPRFIIKTNRQTNLTFILVNFTNFYSPGDTMLSPTGTESLLLGVVI